MEDHRGLRPAGPIGIDRVSEVQQTEYTASASILFRESGVDQELFGYSAFQPSTDQPSQAATNLALVSLPLVASRTAGALHMSHSAVSSAITVSGVGQANIAQINATDTDPVLAARIANTYARQYLALRRGGECGAGLQCPSTGPEGASGAAPGGAARHSRTGATNPGEPADRALGSANRQRRGRAASSRSDVAFCSEHQAQRGHRRPSSACCWTSAWRSWLSASIDGSAIPRAGGRLWGRRPWRRPL